MAGLVWHSFGETWSLGLSVSFDGPTRRIFVHPGVASLDVRTDLYSAWKRWARVDTNAKFPAAFRTTGGDPVGGGIFAGDLYFLMNGWQIVVDHPIGLTGTLYHDDGISPYVIEAGGGVTATVSNLAFSVGSESGGGGLTPAQDATLTQAATDAATAAANAGLTSEQAAQLAIVTQLQTLVDELHKLNGLDGAAPVTITPTGRTFGGIRQTFGGDGTTSSTVSRDP